MKKKMKKMLMFSVMIFALIPIANFTTAWVPIGPPTPPPVPLQFTSVPANIGCDSGDSYSLTWKAKSGYSSGRSVVLQEEIMTGLWSNIGNPVSWSNYAAITYNRIAPTIGYGETTAFRYRLKLTDSSKTIYDYVSVFVHGPPVIPLQFTGIPSNVECGSGVSIELKWKARSTYFTGRFSQLQKFSEYSSSSSEQINFDLPVIKSSNIVNDVPIIDGGVWNTIDDQGSWTNDVYIVYNIDAPVVDRGESRTYYFRIRITDSGGTIEDNVEVKVNGPSLYFIEAPVDISIGSGLEGIISWKASSDSIFFDPKTYAIYNHDNVKVSPAVDNEWVNNQEISYQCTELYDPNDYEYTEYIYRIWVSDTLDSMEVFISIKVYPLENIDSDGDGLSDGEEINVHNSDPNDDMSPSWNLGHFEKDLIGTEPVGWSCDTNDNNIIEVIEAPNWGSNSFDSNLVVLRDIHGHLGDPVLERDVSLNVDTNNYYGFDIAIDYMNQFFNGIVELCGIQIVISDYKFRVKYDGYNSWDGDWLNENELLLDEIVPNKKYHIDVVTTYYGREFDIIDLEYKYITRVEIHIDGNPVFSHHSVNSKNKHDHVKFVADKEIFCPDNEYRLYVDNIRVGNCEAYEEILLANKEIPVILGRNYAPNKGGYNPNDGTPSYQKISFTESKTSSTTYEINAHLGVKHASVTVGTSMKFITKISSTDVSTATIDTGDMIYGNLYHGDLVKSGYKMENALSHIFYSIKITQYAEFEVGFFSHTPEDYILKYRDQNGILTDDFSIDDIPNPKNDAIYEGDYKNAHRTPYSRSGNVDSTVLFESSDINTFEFEFKLKIDDDNYIEFKYQTSTSYTISYFDERMIYNQVGIIDGYFCNFDDYRNIGTWFED